MTEQTKLNFQKIVKIVSKYLDSTYADDFISIAKITRRLAQVNLLSNYKKDNIKKFITDTRQVLNDISEIDNLNAEIDIFEDINLLGYQSAPIFDYCANPKIIERMLEKYAGELQVLLTQIFDYAFYFAYEITDEPTFEYLAEKVDFIYQSLKGINILFSQEFLQQFEDDFVFEQDIPTINLVSITNKYKKIIN